MTNDLFIELSRQVNEALTAATAIVAVSILLYNLTHGPNDRVARASSVLLGCVSVIYVGDVFVSLSRDAATSEFWLRYEWLGIAFAPAALFHLSDALLATTGLISRGRRRRVVRLLYLFGVVFFVVAVGTDLIVRDLLLQPIVMMQPGPLFGLYVIYFVMASLFAFNNVLRARRRCLTRATHRRMTYLLFALVTPVAGIFPYSLLFTQPTYANRAALWLLINIGNLGIILMLVFMAYPLSFFGPKKPDRMIKAELLSFMLRGPVTGIAVLMVILFTPRLRVIGIPSNELMPFLAVAVVMGLQWLFTFAIPFLERKLIYTGDQEQAGQIQELSQHLLTQSDAKQLLEATLAAICDYLRVPSAFVAAIYPDGVRIEQAIGPLQPSAEMLIPNQLTALFSERAGENGQKATSDLSAQAKQNLALPSAYPDPARTTGSMPTVQDTAQVAPSLIPMKAWQSFWLIPLYSTRNGGNGTAANGHNGTGANGYSGNSSRRLTGVMGIWARSPMPDLLPEEEKVFLALLARTARVLDDMRLRDELFTNLESILEETVPLPADDPVRYGNAAEVVRLSAQTETVATSADFTDLIKDALRDYWGGPRLTDERFAQLTAVQKVQPENEGNLAKAVRAVLNKAIEQMKPEGPRSLTMSEWTLYNIIDLRFVQGKKVRDVARQLVMSEADLYRKQRIAINQVAQNFAEIERRASEA